MSNMNPIKEFSRISPLVAVSVLLHVSYAREKLKVKVKCQVSQIAIGSYFLQATTGSPGYLMVGKKAVWTHWHGKH